MKKYNAYEKIGRLFPKGIRRNVKQMMIYADVKIDSDAWLGFNTVFSTLLLIASFLVVFLLSQDRVIALIVSLISTGIFIMLPQLLISLKGDRKADFVEKILPDALLLVVANIRSGLTPEKALLLSARKDFGILSVEIKNSMKHAIAGDNFIEAMKLISKNLKSKVLQRVVTLLIEGVRSGGEIATLLEESAYNIRSNQLLKKEIRSSVLMYIIFLFAAIGFAAPILYGISSYLVTVMNDLLGSINIPPEVLQTSFIKLSSPSITPEFAMQFAIINLMVSSVFGSFIIGMIEAGNAKKGLKYAPILMVVSIGLYLMLRSGLASLISI